MSGAGNEFLLNNINELTANTGVTIDGVLLKDNRIYANRTRHIWLSSPHYYLKCSFS